MGQKTITDVFLTGNELIEILHGFEEVYPEILIHVPGPIGYETCPEATIVGCLRKGFAISLALPGTVALMPFEQGDSPYKRGSIECHHPEKGPGVLAMIFIATLPEAIPDLDLRAACLNRFNRLRRQIHKATSPVTFVSTNGEPPLKRRMSQGAIELVNSGVYLSESGVLAGRRSYFPDMPVEEAVAPPRWYVDELPDKPPVYF